MTKYINSYIKSFKYMLSLLQFKEDKIHDIEFIDEFYSGLDNKDTEVRVFYSNKKNSQSIIIFPGASPYAEEHPGMIMLGNALRHAGYNVFLPRIPNLKNLILVKENIDWFAHCYNELLKHKSINNKVIVVGLSYGGASLLRASLLKEIKNNPPTSILSYGTYFSIETALDFFLTGKIKYNNQEFSIKPHEWGVIVIFYNFFKTLSTEYDQENITKLLKHRIKDEDDKVEKIKNTLNKKDLELINNILSGNVNNKIKNLIDQMIHKNNDLLEYLSPKNWAQDITIKTFIIHGANDSMVPFTESTLLSKHINNSELLISFLYEHREMSTDRGLLFKIREVIKMINFFAFFFKYNEN